MEFLKVELLSPCVTFKTPLSLKGIETYPLPPPSTVIGLLYTALGRKWNGERFSLSIQGDYEAIFRDYIRLRKYNKKDKILQVLPAEVPKLYNFKCVVHIGAEGRLIEEFLKALKSPSRYLYLGGGEYPVLVRDVKIVNAREYSGKRKLKMNAFVSEAARDLFYRFNFIQFRVSTFCRKEKGERVCDWLNVYYIQKGEIVEGNILVDEEGDIVWLLGSM